MILLEEAAAIAMLRQQQLDADVVEDTHVIEGTGRRERRLEVTYVFFLSSQSTIMLSL